MRFEGVLSAWNQDAGYGTIRPSGGGEEVFVGLAAFPTDGEGPRMDEPLSFEIVTSRDGGRKQAVNLKRLSHAHLSPALRASAGGTRIRARQAQKKRRLGLLAGGAVVTVMLVVGGAHWWQPDRGVEVPSVLKR